MNGVEFSRLNEKTGDLDPVGRIYLDGDVLRGEGLGQDILREADRRVREMEPREFLRYLLRSYQTAYLWVNELK